MFSDPQPLQDSLMDDDIAASDPKVPSFKDKLLTEDAWVAEDDEERLVLRHGEDVSVNLAGNVPTISFAPHILNHLHQRMGFAVVIKLLGRNIGYRQLKLQLQRLWKPNGPSSSPTLRRTTSWLGLRMIWIIRML